MTQILFRKDSREVIAIIGENESVVDNDYMLLQCDKVEPMYSLENGKLIVDLTMFIKRESEDTE